MDDNEEDQNLIDDEFDNIPENAWNELEQHALHLAGHLKNEGIQRSRINFEADQDQQFPAEHLERVPNINQEQVQPLEDDNVSQQFASELSRALAADSVSPHCPDRAGLPGQTNLPRPYHAQPRPTPREQWRLQRYAEPSQSLRSRDAEQNQPHLQSHSGGPAVHNTQLGDKSLTAVDATADTYVAQHQHQNTEQEMSMRLQIAELSRQRTELTRELEVARSTIMTHKGEIGIIRANQAKDASEFNKQLTTLKESMQAEAEKRKQDIDATNRRGEKVSIENQFLEHELRSEVEKSKALQMNLKAKETHAPDAAGTDQPPAPRRVQRLPLRDGFDHEDVAVVSPSKTGRRSKPGTPTKAGKKKRKVPDTNSVPALTLHRSSVAVPKDTENEGTKLDDARQTNLAFRQNRRAQKSLQFMQRILNYKIQPGQSRLLEIFSDYFLPSDPERSFTSIVLEESARLSGNSLPADFATILIKLWSRSLQEHYYKPISNIIRAMQYVVALDHSVINAAIISKIVPVLQTTAEVNGYARFKNSPVSYQNSGQSKQSPKLELNALVDGTQTLDMLYTIACFSMHDPELQRKFWQVVDSNFVLLMLHVAQPISDLVLILNLLSTSIQPTTFGTITPTESEQQKAEHHLLNRVAYLLWETLQVDEGMPQPSQHETYELRREALSLLCQVAFPFSSTSFPIDHDNIYRPHHGAALLTSHASLLGRLVRFLYDTVDALYTTTPAILPSSPTHSLISDLINRSTSLLYHLLRYNNTNAAKKESLSTGIDKKLLTSSSAFPPPINLHDKLSAVSGGIQVHRVVLTRLAFIEGIYLESGISDETVAMAHEMLEEFVTPEEAEALMEVFPSSVLSSSSSSSGDEPTEKEKEENKDDGDNDVNVNNDNIGTAASASVHAGVAVDNPQKIVEENVMKIDTKADDHDTGNKKDIPERIEIDLDGQDDDDDDEMETETETESG